MTDAPDEATAIDEAASLATASNGKHAGSALNASSRRVVYAVVKHESPARLEALYFVLPPPRREPREDARTDVAQRAEGDR
jgi:hypothetical protein